MANNGKETGTILYNITIIQIQIDHLFQQTRDIEPTGLAICNAGPRSQPRFQCLVFVVSVILKWSDIIIEITLSPSMIIKSTV